jgi:hypothetical protein
VERLHLGCDGWREGDWLRLLLHPVFLQLGFRLFGFAEEEKKRSAVLVPPRTRAVRWDLLGLLAANHAGGLSVPWEEAIAPHPSKRIARFVWHGGLPAACRAREENIMISFMRSSLESLGSALLTSWRLLLVLSLVLGLTRLCHRISRLAGVWLGEDRYWPFYTYISPNILAGVVDTPFPAS